MAELILNAFWLALSASALILSASGRRSGRMTLLQAFVALACVSVLLFPVVSATDDVCAVQFAAEDSSVLKSSGESSRTNASLQTGAFTAVGAHFDLHASFDCAGFVNVPASRTPVMGTASVLQGRAPPLS